MGAMMRTIEVFIYMKCVVFQLKMLEFFCVGTIKDVYMAIQIRVNIGSGNILMSYGTKSLPEQMLISH